MKFTELTLLIFLFLLTTGAIQSQDMTVTLGTNGVFIIKDATTNWLALNANNGQLDLWSSLRLEKTGSSSTQGVIFKETDRFIHDFRPSGANGYNTFMGINSGNFSMNGTGEFSSYNTGVGYSTLNSLTIGFYNTAIGSFSLNSNTTGWSNTAVGLSSLNDNISGSENIAIGTISLCHNSTGSKNIAIGNASLFHNTIGDSNTAVGYLAMYSNITGNHNTAVGTFSLVGNTTGRDNTAFGLSSGNLITTGNNLTCLGFNANPPASNSQNTITLGDNRITYLRCNVQNISALSDARDKKNIRDLNLGLDFLMNVKPRLFN